MMHSDFIPHLSTHILDLNLGKPAVNVKVELYQQQYDQCWLQLDQQLTNGEGRINRFNLTVSGSLKSTLTDCYKLRFYSGEYYSPQFSFYPYIDILFQLDPTQSDYHIPLTLSPFGYSTYRGC
ncbi:hydroxyisourate hydrolase [Mergibacter septicus]|nr:hydroxyisourate hydrolase [Mergibacter septicus]